MHMIIPYALRIAMAAAILMGSTLSLEGTGVQWAGPGSTTITSDLLLNTNWQAQTVPQAGGNPAIFATGGSATPTLESGETLSLDLLTFNSGASSYFFQINGALNFVGSSTAAPFTTGVQNLGASVQLFDIFDDGEVQFSNSTNAAFGASSNVNTVTYNVGDATTETPGTMTFNNNATAGGAQINLTEDSMLNFYNTSTADSSSITLQGNSSSQNNSTLNFFDSTDAGTAAIMSVGSNINFNSLSSAEDATILLQGASLFSNYYVPSVLDFSQFATAGNAVINVLDTSIVTFFDNTSAGDSTINLGTGASSTAPIGLLDFLDNSQAGSAIINAQGGYVSGGVTYQSSVVFDDHSQADAAIINLGDSSTGIGAKLSFYKYSNAGTALINAGQTSSIVFNYQTSANQAHFTLNDNASLNFRGYSTSSKSTINLASPNAALNFAQASADTFQGTLSGIGILNKIGPGWLNFSGDGSAFTGQTNVNVGVMAINTSLGGNVAVNNGGTLAGQGTLLGNLTVNSGGNVSPGLGTLKVDGDFVQEAGSVYQVQVDISGDPSLLNIGGSALLQPDAAVNIATVGNVSQLAPNQVLEATIMLASGGISGTYPIITSSNPLITGKLTYDEDGIYAVFVNTLSLLAKTHNQVQVSDQLQTISNPTAQESIFLNALALSPDPQAQHVLDQLSARLYSDVIAAAELSNQQLIQRLYDPLRPLITQNPCCVDECNDPCADKGWALWVDGGFDRSCTNRHKKSEGFTSCGYDYTIGAQAVIDCDWTMGTALSYEKNYLHYHLGGRGKNYGVFGALYALYRPADYYILSDFIVGYNRQQVSRHIEPGNLSYHAWGYPELLQGAYYIEAGKDYAWNRLVLQPFLGLEADYFRRNHFTEHHHSNSFLDLSVDEKSYGTGFSRLGVHLTTQRRWGVILAVDLAWRYRFVSLDNDLRVRFPEFGSSFTVRGSEMRRNSIDGTLNLSATLADGWDVFIDASGQWWQRAYFYSLLGGLKIDW